MALYKSAILDVVIDGRKIVEEPISVASPNLKSPRETRSGRYAVIVDLIHMGKISIRRYATLEDAMYRYTTWINTSSMSPTVLWDMEERRAIQQRFDFKEYDPELIEHWITVHALANS